MAIDLRTALETARAEREAAEGQLHEVEAKIESLDIEITGLEMAFARHNGKAEPSSGLSPSEARKWKRMHRTDAIIRVLTEAGEPMGPRDITDVLLSVGRKDQRKLVAAAIQYLKRERRVHWLGRGQWVPGPDPNTGGTS